MNDIIKLKLTEKSNKKELQYREEVQPTEEEFKSVEQWTSRITSDGRFDYLKKIFTKIKFKGTILEIGAGSCWFSSELSKLDSVNKIYCLDFSERIIKDIAPGIMNYLKANTNKIIPVVGDFYNLDFKEKMFDMIVVDAALHHIEDMESALIEIKKVLKDDGVIIAIREPILPKLRKNAEKEFGAHERELGVTEYIYTKKEWKNLFEKNGFNLEFIPIIPEYNSKYKIINIVPLRYLNGLLFAHYVFRARKK
jgi:ubiquinone/menaquinone biosynthesis C-methylase UbiE